MKIVKFIEMHREMLKMLRKNGIKLGYVDFTEMYQDYKALRSAPGSKHAEVLREICDKYHIGHTKAWEIIKTFDQDI